MLADANQCVLVEKRTDFCQIPETFKINTLFRHTDTTKCMEEVVCPSQFYKELFISLFSHTGHRQISLSPN